jgi:hypothetical protein
MELNAHFAEDLYSQPWSRRYFITAATVGAGALMFAGQAAAQRPALSRGPLGALVTDYLRTAGVGEDLLDVIKGAGIDFGQPAFLNATSEVSSFHIAYSAQWRIVAYPVESRLPSGAYVRIERAILHDSISPRPFKDVNEHEMRCALIPEVRGRFDGIVPFPCGPREPFSGAWRDTFEMTVDFYRNYHNIDAGNCNIDYIRPAQTVARINADRPAVPSFGVSTKTAPIQRSLLFAPDAVG